MKNKQTKRHICKGRFELVFYLFDVSGAGITFVPTFKASPDLRRQLRLPSHVKPCSRPGMLKVHILKLHFSLSPVGIDKRSM